MNVPQILKKNNEMQKGRWLRNQSVNEMLEFELKV